MSKDRFSFSGVGYGEVNFSDFRRGSPRDCWRNLFSKPQCRDGENAIWCDVAAAWRLCVGLSGTSSFVSAASWLLSLTPSGIAWPLVWPRCYFLRCFGSHAARMPGATRQGLRRRAVGWRLFVSSHFLNVPDGKSCNDFTPEAREFRRNAGNWFCAPVFAPSARCARSGQALSRTAEAAVST
jgi:hypothetical protein